MNSFSDQIKDAIFPGAEEIAFINISVFLDTYVMWDIMSREHRNIWYAFISELRLGTDHDRIPES